MDLFLFLLGVFLGTLLGVAIGMYLGFRAGAVERSLVDTAAKILQSERDLLANELRHQRRFTNESVELN